MIMICPAGGSMYIPRAPLKARQIHMIPHEYKAPETSGREPEIRDVETNEFRIELAGAAGK
jgi:hypothetical protein